MRDTLLMVGNGLAIDFRNHSLKMPNPSCPLDFSLPTPGIPGKSLRITFSELWQVIDEIRMMMPEIPDFELINRIRLLPWPPRPTERSRNQDFAEAAKSFHKRSLIETQLRLYLTHAYVHFTQSIDKNELKTWRWHSWILENKNSLDIIISFNYDLLIEETARLVVPVRYLIAQRFQVYGLRPEIIVFKPHGSINFELSSHVIHFGDDPNTLYDKKNIFNLMDVPISVLGPDHLNNQRLGSDIVLPTETTKIRGFQYITPGYNYVNSNKNYISKCVIAGLSYWDCDRPEIDEILNLLRKDTKILICNPHPSSDMISFVKARFHQVIVLGSNLP